MEGGIRGVVVVISALLIQLLVFGVSAAVGIYNIEFLEYFHATVSEISIIASLNYGVFLGSGPFVSYLMSKYSFRKISLCGSLLVVLGILAVPLWPNLYALYLTLGVITGFGSCCVYIPSHTLSGMYYDKYRSLATGIVTSGGGLGMFLLPVFTGIFIDIYTWKGSFVILAGLCLHLFVLCSFLKSPPPSVVTTIKEEEIIVNVINKGVSSDNDDVNNIVVPVLLETIKETTSEEESSLLLLSSSKVGSDYHHNEKEEDKEEEEDLLLSKNNKNDDNCGLVIKSKQGVNGSGDNNVEKSNVNNTKQPDTTRHIHIFKHCNFDIYFVNNIFWNMSLSMLQAFAPEFFHRNSMTLMESSWLLGSVGLGIFFGGILGGLIGNFERVNRVLLFAISNILSGIFIMFIPFYGGLVYFAVMMSLAGIFIGIILGLLIVVLTDLIGIESLGNGMGYIMLGNGMGTLTGPIFGGMLVDSTGSFASSIYLAGLLCTIAGVVLLIIPIKQSFHQCGGQQHKARRNIPGLLTEEKEIKYIPKKEIDSGTSV